MGQGEEGFSERDRVSIAWNLCKDRWTELSPQGSPPLGGALSPQGSPPLGGALSPQGSPPLGGALSPQGKKKTMLINFPCYLPFLICFVRCYVFFSGFIVGVWRSFDCFFVLILWCFFPVRFTFLLLVHAEEFSLG